MYGEIGYQSIKQVQLLNKEIVRLVLADSIGCDWIDEVGLTRLLLKGNQLLTISVRGLVRGERKERFDAYNQRCRQNKGEA